MQLHEALTVARRGWWLIALGAVVGAAIAALVSTPAATTYSSSTQVFMRGNADTARQLADAANVATTRVPSYAVLASGNEVARRVADRLGLEPAEVIGKVQAIAVPATVVINITATDTDADRAGEIAGAAADELAALVEELETPPGQPESVVLAQVVGEPSAPIASSSDGRRTIALGGVVGLLAGFGIAVLRDLRSPRRRTQRLDAQA